MTRILMIISLCIALLACENKKNKQQHEDAISHDAGELIQVRNTFEENKVTDVEMDLLKELDICNSGTDSMLTPCSSKYFTFHKFRDDKDLKDAFVMQVRGGVMLKGEDKPFPVRRLLVFERENGELIRVNGFVADLGAFVETDTDVKDMILVFYDNRDDVLFHCLFEWKDKKYKFNKVQAIDIGPGPKAVKESNQEEVSKDVYSLLVEKSMLF